MICCYCISIKKIKFFWKSVPCFELYYEVKHTEIYIYIYIYIYNTHLPNINYPFKNQSKIK
jgi:hypothetical protein